ncbi:hypothetical protein U5817_10045 [Aromatoleum evansii]|uniref:Tip attachment protein J domain-containing protein n=1 Tax=Aromatoleum evansii TaxID=59406 RepID=A0ABZ1AVZ7_AROEV|nr:hypothetical protein U5817_09695 [Aromatoleum evansii]WRL48368.1 hypothetical protein U5817_10045 [Aromatoleum evansii]
MRIDCSALSADTLRSVTVTLYKSATLAEIVSGTAGGGFDLSPFVSGGSQTAQEASLRLSWHSELYGANQPASGDLLKIAQNGVSIFVGIVEGINDYRLQSGERSMTITARSRDAFPFWRSVRRVTDIYPMATRLEIIARDIADECGLTEAEIDLPAILYAVPHSNVQIADLSAWDMLESLLLPAGLSPFIDARGRLKARSRDVTRAADQTITEDRIVSVTGSRSRPPISSLKVKWLDPLLTEVAQQDQALANANITAGFFQLRQRQDVYWSDDRTQRAKNTRLVVKQSANSGILPVCDEDYDQTAHTGGRITLTTSAFVPGLIGAFLGLKIAWAIPDIAPPFGGPTATLGKQIAAGLEFGVLLTMASIGTGVYEVWGTPYDFVHARHTTEAYDPAAPEWLEAAEIIETDLVQNDAHAQAIAARELIYRARSARSYGMTIVDDPRIEPGDIIATPDGARLYVTGYRRNLSPGAPAVLELEGFAA